MIRLTNASSYVGDVGSDLAAAYTAIWSCQRSGTEWPSNDSIEPIAPPLKPLSVSPPTSGRMPVSVCEVSGASVCDAAFGASGCAAARPHSEPTSAVASAARWKLRCTSLRIAAPVPSVAGLELEANDARALLLEHLTQLPLSELLAQACGPVTRGAADGGQRAHARAGDGRRGRGVANDRAIGRVTQRAIDRDHQAVEHHLGVGEHALLVVAPGETARDRVVQLAVEAGNGLAADRPRAQPRLEDLGARRIAIAVLAGVEDLVAEDGDGFDEVDVRHLPLRGAALVPRLRLVDGRRELLLELGALAFGARDLIAELRCRRLRLAQAVGERRDGFEHEARDRADEALVRRRQCAEDLRAPRIRHADLVNARGGDDANRIEGVVERHDAGVVDGAHAVEVARAER